MPLVPNSYRQEYSKGERKYMVRLVMSGVAAFVVLSLQYAAGSFSGVAFLLASLAVLVLVVAVGSVLIFRERSEASSLMAVQSDPPKNRRSPSGLSVASSNGNHRTTAPTQRIESKKAAS